MKNFVSETHENTDKSKDSKDKRKKATGEEMSPVENMHQCNMDKAAAMVLSNIEDIEEAIQESQEAKRQQYLKECMPYVEKLPVSQWMKMH